ncbi:MAG: bifunctional oligoribonuclease/PAP phosphatase NrnA [Candidatus Falkowbacteria bacterium]
MNEFLIKFELLFSKIKSAKNILIVSHVHPDVDAISSLGAIIEVLKNLEKTFFAFAAQKEELAMHYLPHEELIHGSLPDNFNFSEFDLIVVLDCGSLSRTQLESYIKNRREDQFVVELDHHPRTDDYADLEIRLAQLSSTTEVIFNFIKSQNIKITKNLANCLMSGILCDTGNFAYSSTSDTTIKIVAELVEHGAQFPKMMRSFSENKDINSLKIWGLALDNLKINKRYNIGVSVLTKDEILKTTGVNSLLDINSEIFGEIVAFLSGLVDVSAVVLIREDDEQRLKVNLRTSSNNVNLSSLAQIFGGGGHVKASGFLISGKINKNNSGWEFDFVN